MEQRFILCILISSVWSLSHVQLFATPWTAARLASLSITNSWSLLKIITIKTVMPSNHLVLCQPLLLLPAILPSIRVLSNESLNQVAKVLELLHWTTGALFSQGKEILKNAFTPPKGRQIMLYRSKDRSSSELIKPFFSQIIDLVLYTHTYTHIQSCHIIHEFIYFFIIYQ